MPGTAPDGRRKDALVDLVAMCFAPDGTLEPRYKDDLDGWLGAAKLEGLDPQEVYAEAVSLLRNPKAAPPYADVAPQNAHP